MVVLVCVISTHLLQLVILFSSGDSSAEGEVDEESEAPKPVDSTETEKVQGSAGPARDQAGNGDAGRDKTN